MNRCKKLYLVFIPALLVLITSCGNDDEGDDLENFMTIESPNSPNASSYSRYLRTMYGVSRDFYLDFAHETGAEPFSRDEDWDFTHTNLNAVFARRSLDTKIHVPWRSRSFAPTGDSTFSLDQILSLAEQHRLHEPTVTEPSVFVMVLNGFLEQNGEISDRVVGVNVNSTSVVAVFRGAIAALNTSEENKRKIEQATYVHELGHALGLVRKGVPTTSNHHDTDNENHCTNPECVMYYTNEVSGKMEGFIMRKTYNENEVVFDEDCLNDIEEFQK